jgi:hypothetical protein
VLCRVEQPTGAPSEAQSPMRDGPTTAAMLCLALSSLVSSCEAAPRPPRVTVEVDGPIYKLGDPGTGAGPV